MSLVSRLDREKAESLLTCSGDFLVRESSSASGQYVLSGMEGATVRHILLVDSHGQVVSAARLRNIRPPPCRLCWPLLEV
uniref:SH2 domain-containing protein n=1 Tax=Xiphophorus couchianus TaxID=32473 RepID=A0A3B5MXD4_9TELE